ncbi:hypothetical protein Taro_018091, partial [Colocasia esculenta]|nr:hypothetical protein [Colocasia esculenta]
MIYFGLTWLQVLLHGDHMAVSWDNIGIPLFSKVLQFCPDDFLDAEDVISLATELYDALHGDACKLLEVWARVVSDFFEDCTKKLHMLEKQTTDTWKLLAKKLAFCLEDVIFVARLAHEILARGENNSRSFLLSLYKHCIKCVRTTLIVMNAK